MIDAKRAAFPMRKTRTAHNARVFAALILATLAVLPDSPRADGPEKIQLSSGLKELLNSAMKNSPAMKIAPVKMQAAEQELEALPVWYLPDVYSEAGYGGAANTKESRVGPLARLVAEWTFWDNGRRESKERMVRIDGKRARIQSTLQKVDYGKHLGLLYLRICRLQSVLETQRSMLREYQILERLLGPRLRIGTASYSDLVNVRIRVQNLRSEMGDTSRAMHSLKRQLAIQAGFQPENLPAAVNLGFSRPVSGAKAEYLTLEEHPLYAGYNLAERYLNAKEELAYKNIYGMDLSLRIYGGYGPDLDAISPEKPEAGAQLRFRIPIFGSGDRESAFQAQKSHIQAQRLQWEQALLELKSEIQQKKMDLNRHRDRLQSLSYLVGQARRGLNLSYGDFRNGQKSPADMIASIDTYADLRLRQLDRLFEWQLLLLETSLLRTFGSELLSNDLEESDADFKPQSPEDSESNDPDDSGTDPSEISEGSE